VPSFVPDLGLRAPQVDTVMVLLVLLNRMDSPAKWASDLPVFLKFAIKWHLRFSSHAPIVPLPKGLGNYARV